MTTAHYLDRAHAGRMLALDLDRWKGSDVMVLGLPRGGVPVAAEVAAALGAPLDVVVVRKIGFPGHAEYAMGAMATAAGHTAVVQNPGLAAELRRAGFAPAVFDRVAERERAELARRESAYRGNRGTLRLQGRTVILVDDGAATGATLRAAVEVVRGLDPGLLIAAVPVGSVDAAAELSRIVDVLVCPWQPEPFGSVGQAYANFHQTSDGEVTTLLAEGTRG